MVEQLKGLLSGIHVLDLAAPWAELAGRLLASTRAAADALIALNERALSGRGQRLDTSIQEAIISSLMNYPGYPSHTGGDPPGLGDDRADPAVGAPAHPSLRLCECADGYVLATNITPVQPNRVMPSSVIPALEERGLLPPRLREIDWDTWVDDMYAGSIPDDLQGMVFDAVKEFFRPRTKSELMEWAWAHDIFLGPVNTTRDLLENPTYRRGITGSKSAAMPIPGRCPGSPARRRFCGGPPPPWVRTRKSSMTG